MKTNTILNILAYGDSQAIYWERKYDGIIEWLLLFDGDWRVEKVDRKGKNQGIMPLNYFKK